MSANGPGVLMDAAATPTFIAYHDETNVDTQSDAYGNFAYDVRKVWACMGRNDQQGTPVMRYGLIEKPTYVANANALVGIPACSIMVSIDGNPPALPDYWDTLIQINTQLALLKTGASGGGGGYILYRAPAQFSGIMHHLGGFLSANPAYNIEVLTASAGVGTWAGVTLGAKTFDFTGANGGAPGTYKNQRCEFTKPTTWPSLAFGPNINGVQPVGYFARLQFTSGPGTEFLLLNTLYKDWLYGYFTHYYSYFSLQKGQTNSSSTATTFVEDGNTGIEFRNTFKPTVGGNTTTTTQWGAYDGSAMRTAVRKPWYIISSRGADMQPAELFGGAVMGVLESPTQNSANDSRYRGNGNDKGRIIGCLLSGHARYQFGVSGGNEMKQLDDVRVVKDSSRTDDAITNLRLVPSSSNPIVNRVSIDNHPGGGSAHILGSSATDLTIYGYDFGHDDVSVSQIFRTSGGNPNFWRLLRCRRGGPNKFWGAATPASLGDMLEFWYLMIAVRDRALNQPLDGIRVRAKDTNLFEQLSGVTGAGGAASGTISVTNTIAGAPVVGTIAKNLFCVERGGDGVGTTPVLLDAPVTIEINPADATEFNPAYASVVIKAPFPRAYEYDPATAAYVEHSWQRTDWGCTVALPLACPTVSPPVTITVQELPIVAPGVERDIDVVAPVAS